jgi:hypothetical protein
VQQLTKSEMGTTYTTLQGSLQRTKWMDAKGPNGGRNVIDNFFLVATGTITVAGATWAGEDVARLLASIRVEQMDGTMRWALAGDLTRIASFACLGADQVQEHPDIGVGAGAAVFQSWTLPMRKPFAHTPGDFSMAVDDFKQLTLDWNTLGAAQAAATLSVPSLQVYALAEIREEMDLRLKNIDQVQQFDTTSLTEMTIEVNAKLHDLYFHAAGNDGGASLANLTDARIDGYVPTFTRQEMQLRYRTAREIGNVSAATQAAEMKADPFLFPTPATAKALAMIIHGKETSPWTGKVWAERVKVNLTNTVASLRAITRKVTAMTEQARNAACAKYGVTPAAFRVATAAKSSRNPMDWPEEMRGYLPLKADLPKKAG